MDLYKLGRELRRAAENINNVRREHHRVMMGLRVQLHTLSVERRTLPSLALNRARRLVDEYLAEKWEGEDMRKHLRLFERTLEEERYESLGR